MRGGERRGTPRRSLYSDLASELRSSARTATYVERPVEGANEAAGPLSAACYIFMCGSSQSRSPLPMRLMTRVVTKIARPGKVAIHHELSM